MNLSEHIDPLIIDYLDNNLSDENRLELERMLEHSAELRSYFEDFKVVWEGEAQEVFDDELAQHKFKERIAREKKTSYRLPMSWLRVAAIVAFVITSGLGLFQFGYQLSSNQHLTTLSCLEGEKAAIMLPDSSRVWINSSSSLSYRGRLDKDTRQVYLEGEAYFEVKSDKIHPFIVNAHNVTIRATGTKFNVSAYKDHNVVRTALIEGVVRVCANENQYTMQANDLVTVNIKNNKIWHHQMESIDDMLAWRHGQLVFRNEKLHLIRPQLERFYNIKIVIDAHLKEVRFSGTFEDETLDEFIRILEMTLGVGVDFKDNILFIKETI